MKLIYKYQIGDIVKHKTGGPKMIIVDLSQYSDSINRWAELDFKWGDRLGYLCRFFIPKSAEINVANASASGHGGFFGDGEASATAIATGQGSYETRHFFEIELVKFK